ncbi:hypothetical protein BFJ69_g8145 [Fusarium oxysporum]|uniref:Uncharacterized protein n=1 Tax=Fusarium oxysporum TaxID=5507 RepID=A0A420N3G7_FUSOX|nr:hypothetical protein BFJ69_g8145 [Fusarium oxysporum]
MNAADHAHLAAMGMAIPSSEASALPLPLTRRQAIRGRATALRVHTLRRSVTPTRYLLRHNGMRIAGRRRFGEARRQHKLMQKWQNDEAEAYRRRVAALVDGPNPVWTFRGHLQWLPGFLANGEVPLQERKRVANHAEDAAHFAIEQAEKHHRLLKKWVWGYNTLASRRQHEGYARLAHRAAVH